MGVRVLTMRASRAKSREMAWLGPPCEPDPHSRWGPTLPIALAVCVTLAAPAATASAACEDRAALVSQLEAAAIEGRIADASGLRRRVEAALACGYPVAPEHLARLWITDAVVATAEADGEAARDALSAAARVAPDVSAERFGPPIARRHEEAKRLPPAGLGTVRLESLPDRAVALLDGQPLLSPRAEVTAGLHVAQAGWSADEVTFAREIYVPAGHELVVPVVLPPSTPPHPAPTMPPVAVEPTRPRRPGGLLVLAALSATGAAVTAGLAEAQVPKVMEAPTPRAVNREFAKSVRYGATSYTLMGVTAVSLGLYVAYEWEER